MVLRKFLLAFFLLIVIILVSAHQPRLVQEHEVEIDSPEISQAFYGELKGKPDHYHIHTEESFDFYTGILVPDIEGIDKDISVRVSRADEEIFLLDGENHVWTKFYEEFAGDYYFDGPEVEARLGPGDYHLEVLSPDNQGKYVLAVGKIESFTLDETFNTLFTLPALKEEFFGKPFWTAYFNLIGLFIFGPIIALCLIAALAIWIYFRRKSANHLNKK